MLTINEFALLLALIIVQLLLGETQSLNKAEHAFFEKKFRYYNNHVRPDTKGKKYVSVSSRVHIHHAYVSKEDNRINLQMNINSEWDDSRLDISPLNVPRDLVIPEQFRPWEPAYTTSQFKIARNYYIAQTYTTGSVRQNLVLEGPLHCHYNKFHVPFETLRCVAEIEYESGVHFKMLDLYFTNDPEFLSHGYERWNYTVQYVKRRRNTALTFEIYLSKKLEPFVYSILLPSLLCVAMIFTGIFGKRRNHRTTMSTIGVALLLFMWLRVGPNPLSMRDIWFFGCMAVELFILLDFNFVMQIRKQKVVLDNGIEQQHHQQQRHNNNNNSNNNIEIELTNTSKSWWRSKFPRTFRTTVTKRSYYYRNLHAYLPSGRTALRRCLRITAIVYFLLFLCWYLSYTLYLTR